MWRCINVESWSNIGSEFRVANNYAIENGNNIVEIKKRGGKSAQCVMCSGYSFSRRISSTKSQVTLTWMDGLTVPHRIIFQVQSLLNSSSCMVISVHNEGRSFSLYSNSHECTEKVGHCCSPVNSVHVENHL